MFFDGKEIPVERLKTALRKATIAGDVLPMLCGSAFKNKGVQPLLDAVVDFLALAARSQDDHRQGSQERRRHHAQGRRQ